MYHVSFSAALFGTFSKCTVRMGCVNKITQFNHVCSKMFDIIIRFICVRLQRKGEKKHCCALFYILWENLKYSSTFGDPPSSLVFCTTVLWSAVTVLIFSQQRYNFWWSIKLFSLWRFSCDISLLLQNIWTCLRTCVLISPIFFDDFLWFGAPDVEVDSCRDVTLTSSSTSFVSGMLWHWYRKRFIQI